MSKTTIPAGGITDGTLTSAKLDQDGAFTFNEDSGNVDFRVESNGDANCLIVDGSGDKVGIGEDVPEGKLHVFSGDASIGPNAKADELVVEGSAHSGITILSGASSDGSIYFGAGSDDNIGQIAYAHDSNLMQFVTNANERMRIDSSGNLLVSTTSTTINASNFGTKIIDGKISTSGNLNGGSTITESFGNAGQIRFMGDGDAENTNNSYGALSDRTLKENETSASSQWDDIKALQIKNYNLIAYPDRPHLGVIAQDLESAGMTGLVKTDSDGLKSVKYSVLYMKAVKALQEAMTKIEDLETRVTTLEG